MLQQMQVSFCFPFNSYIRRISSYILNSKISTILITTCYSNDAFSYLSSFFNNLIFSFRLFLSDNLSFKSYLKCIGVSPFLEIAVLLCCRCSQEKHPVVQLSIFKPVRVCKDCFIELSGRSKADSSAKHAPTDLG